MTTYDDDELMNSPYEFYEGDAPPDLSYLIAMLDAGLEPDLSTPSDPEPPQSLTDVIFDAPLDIMFAWEGASVLRAFDANTDGTLATFSISQIPNATVGDGTLSVNGDVVATWGGSAFRLDDELANVLVQ